MNNMKMNEYQSPYKGFNSNRNWRILWDLRLSINPPIRGSIDKSYHFNSCDYWMYQSPYKGFNSKEEKITK